MSSNVLIIRASFTDASHLSAQAAVDFIMLDFSSVRNIIPFESKLYLARPWKSHTLSIVSSTSCSSMVDGTNGMFDTVARTFDTTLSYRVVLMSRKARDKGQRRVCKLFSDVPSN